MLYLILLFYVLPTVALYILSVKHLEYEEIDWRHVLCVFFPVVNIFVALILLIMVAEDTIDFENLPKKIFLKKKKK